MWHYSSKCDITHSYVTRLNRFGQNVFMRNMTHFFFSRDMDARRPLRRRLLQIVLRVACGSLVTPLIRLRALSLSLARSRALSLSLSRCRWRLWSGCMRSFSVWLARALYLVLSLMSGDASDQAARAPSLHRSLALSLTLSLSLALALPLLHSLFNSLQVYVHIYIERTILSFTCVCVYIYVYINIYIDIDIHRYIYTCRNI